MKLLKRTILTMLILLMLTTPALSLAESDYETGDGWIFQDGTLTITDNGGLKDFEFYEHDPVTGEWTRNHTVEDVNTLIIGKNITELAIEIYDWNVLSPTNIIIENGNINFANIDGWIINTKTNTLLGASNIAQTRTMKSIDDIPDRVEHIGARAFSFYQELQQIHLPQNIVSIGERAFENCNKLKVFEMPNSLISIGDIAFDQCVMLSSVKLNANIEYIGYSAFNMCESLEEVNLNDTKVQVLTNTSFGACVQLKFLQLPDTVAKIESQALNGCQQLDTLIITSNKIMIESDAFGYCENLRKIVFTKGTPGSLGDNLFTEARKAPDGRSYISSSSDRNGEIIPYPTLYYTAAYANEWAPNGETEWNGYQIQQISQEELDAVLAEARGEAIPATVSSPVPTPTTVDMTAQEPVATSVDKDEPDQATSTVVKILLLSAIVAVAAGIVAFAILQKQKIRK